MSSSTLSTACLSPQYSSFLIARLEITFPSQSQYANGNVMASESQSKVNVKGAMPTSLSLVTVAYCRKQKASQIKRLTQAAN